MTANAAIFRPSRRRTGDDFLTTHLQRQLEERCALAKPSTDITTSVCVLATTNDVPGALARIYDTMPVGGLFMAAFFGGGTLAELRTSLLAAETAVTGHAALRVAPMISPIGGVALMQRAGFAAPVIDSEVLTATYASLGKLVSDLRAAGLAGVLTDRHFLPRTVWAATAAHYATHFADARGRLTATFETVFLSGWKNQMPQ